MVLAHSRLDDFRFDVIGYFVIEERRKAQKLRASGLGRRRSRMDYYDAPTEEHHEYAIQTRRLARERSQHYGA